MLADRHAWEHEVREKKEKAGRLDMAVTIITALVSILTLPEGAKGF